MRLGLTPSTSWLRPVAIRPVYLDVMPPAGRHAFDLPPGRSTRSWEGRPAVAARLLAAGSHLHDYGTGLKLEDVSAGKLLWEARPKLDDKGEVVGMPIHYFLPFGVQLTPDHRVPHHGRIQQPDRGRCWKTAGWVLSAESCCPRMATHGLQSPGETPSTCTMCGYRGPALK